MIADGARELQEQAFAHRATLNFWREIMERPDPRRILQFTHRLATLAAAGVDRDDLERLHVLTRLTLTEKQRARLAGRARSSRTT